MITPNRALSLLTPLLAILVTGFVVVLLYGIVANNDFDNDDTVTVTFRCGNVLTHQNNYPDFVIEQCKNVRKK